MAQQNPMPMPIPLHFVPYEALYELADVFDSPAVDGQRTLEGLAEAIYKLSNYAIRVDHNKVMAIRARCSSGDSPTVRFILDLAKFKQANLQILQAAIRSLDTRAEEVLPKYYEEVIRRFEADRRHGVCKHDDKSSQHACNCNECSISHSGGNPSHPLPLRVIKPPNNKQISKHRCEKPGCVHNHTPGTRAPQHRENRRSQNGGFPSGVLPNNVEGAVSCSLNISDHSDIQNNNVMTTVDDHLSESPSMHLFGNGLGLSPPEDFNPIPPSEYGEDDEDDDATSVKYSTPKDTQSELFLRPRHDAFERRINSDPTYGVSGTENNDNTRRHSHPIFKHGKKTKRKDCESEGDIPNIPDACTCYRSPIITIAPRTVFVSLADDSKHHIKEVLTMCNKLKQGGFEVKCDMMESLFREQSINVNEWLDQCFTKSMFVVFCISPKYYRHVQADSSAEAQPSDNKFHTRYIFDRARTEFIQNNSINRRFLPVLFRNSNAKNAHIPEFLRSTLKYVFPDTFSHLTDFMIKSMDRFT